MYMSQLNIARDEIIIDQPESEEDTDTTDEFEDEF